VYMKEDQFTVDRSLPPAMGLCWNPRAGALHQDGRGYCVIADLMLVDDDAQERVWSAS